MFPDNKKISNRQLFRLLCIDILGPAILLLPKVLAGYAGSYGVVCILLGCLAGFLYARLIIWLFMHKKEFYKYKLLKMGDLLVDGPFQLDKRNTAIPFRGSTNQRIINVPKSLKSSKAIIMDF